MGYTESIVGRIHTRKSLQEIRVNPCDLKDTSRNEFPSEVIFKQWIAPQGQVWDHHKTLLMKWFTNWNCGNVEVKEVLRIFASFL